MPVMGVCNMKTYLISFFEEFAYAQEDTQCLLNAYDTICLHATAARILQQLLAAYEQDHQLDYQTEVLDRAKEISDITQLHPYTVDILVFLCMSKHLRALYRKNQLPMQIYKDSMLDMKWKLRECKAVKGICGTFVAGWYPGFFKLDRFALGRLQFELRTARYDYRKNGITLEKEKSPVINVHIPGTGTPIDKNSCDQAYAAAKAFFKARTGKDCPFVCNSWLLYPENKRILPPSTNTYRFLSEYDVIDWGENQGQDLWRLFDTDETDPDKLPANGSLRRCYIAHLKNGGSVGWGYGVRP